MRFLLQDGGQAHPFAPDPSVPLGMRELYRIDADQGVPSHARSLHAVTAPPKRDGIFAEIDAYQG
jgi:hypothetical protein